MTQAELGFADAYVNGDCSFVDEDEGLLNFFRTSELFAFLLGETMQYFCAIFKTKDEDLKSAQKRKISILIEKARIEKKHEALEIGFGWGIFAIELVKQTGCKYTGITLSEEQLHFAQKKVAEAGLQDNIKFLLCDYCQFPNNSKYDRIISVEVL
nr:probable fatty acid methyltransferase [Ziziphus jujuba var. spinosa]